MISDQPRLRVVGEDDNAKRRQIMDGASKLFLDLGFDGASMGEIARAAGVSKGTLYVYFSDKSSLFEAIVERQILEQGSATFIFDHSVSVAADLNRFGRAFIEVVCRPEGGSALRTVMAIAERMPDVGRRFYEKVIAFTVQRLSEYLVTRVATGELVIDDVELAATQFLELCKATLFQPYLFQVRQTPTADQIAPVVDSATRVFMAAYGATTPSRSPT